MKANPATRYSSLFIGRLRQQVDRLDDRLLVLLQQRLGLAGELGRLKRETGLPLRDPVREQEILDRLARAGNGVLPPDAIREVFRCVIEVSLASEERDTTSCD